MSLRLYVLNGLDQAASKKIRQTKKKKGVKRSRGAAVENEENIELDSFERFPEYRPYLKITVKRWG